MPRNIEKAVSQLATIAKKAVSVESRNITCSATAQQPAHRGAVPVNDVFKPLLPVAERLLAGANQQWGSNMSTVARDATLSPVERAEAFRMRRSVNDISHKIGIVTGAAGNIGSATSYMKASNGMALVLSDHPNAIGKLHHVAETCRLLGARDVLVAPYDLSTDAGRTSLIDQTLRLGKPHVLTNCMGVYMEGGIWDIDPTRRIAKEKQFDMVMNLNVKVPLILTEQVAHHMDPGAHIIHFNSKAGVEPVRDEWLYVVSKAGLNLGLESLQFELGKFGVKISQIFPSALLGKMAEGRNGLEPELLHFPEPLANAVEAIIKTLGNTNLSRIDVGSAISPYVEDHV